MGGFFCDTSLSMMDTKLVTVKAFLDVGLYESMPWACWGASKWVQNEPHTVADSTYDAGLPLPEDFIPQISLEDFRIGPPSIQRVCHKNKYGRYLQENCLLREFSQTFLLLGSRNQRIKGRSPCNAREWFLGRRGSQDLCRVQQGRLRRPTRIFARRSSKGREGEAVRPCNFHRKHYFPESPLKASISKINLHIIIKQFCITVVPLGNDVCSLFKTVFLPKQM